MSVIHDMQARPDDLSPEEREAQALARTLRIVAKEEERTNRRLSEELRRAADLLCEGATARATLRRQVACPQCRATNILDLTDDTDTTYKRVCLTCHHEWRVP